MAPGSCSSSLYRDGRLVHQKRGDDSCSRPAVFYRPRPPTVTDLRRPGSVTEGTGLSPIRDGVTHGRWNRDPANCPNGPGGGGGGRKTHFHVCPHDGRHPEITQNAVEQQGKTLFQGVLHELGLSPIVFCRWYDALPAVRKHAARVTSLPLLSIATPAMSRLAL